MYPDSPYIQNPVTGQVLRNPYYQGDPSVYSQQQATAPSQGNQAAGAAGQVAGLGAGNYLGSMAGTSAAAAPVAAPTGLGAAMSTLPVSGVGTAGASSAPAAASSPFMGIGAAPALGVAGGIALGAKGLKDLFNRKQGTSSPEGLGGRATIGIAMGGLSELYRGLGGAQKSTGQYQAERLGEVKDSGDLGWVDFLTQARQGADSNNDTWQDGKFAGQKWSYDKALELAKEDPTHFLGVMGNAQTFGDDWHHIGIDKQKEITKQLIDGGYYHSDKGDILIEKAKQDQARQLYEQMMNGGQQVNKPYMTNGSQNMESLATALIKK